MHNFEEPIYAFVPSIGISEIIKIPESKFVSWKNNYLVSSLYKVVFLEKKVKISIKLSSWKKFLLLINFDLKFID